MEKKDCCGVEKKSKSLLVGMLYGLVPHLGCIFFIIGSLLGSTLLIKAFKPFLISKYSFYFLIGISLSAATFSSLLFLKKNQSLSLQGARKRWKYLSFMYGSTVGVNLLLFLVIFPLFADFSASAGMSREDSSSLILKVDIPCTGHAPLISEELKNLEGISEIKFDFPDYFKIRYNPKKISEKKILTLEIFNNYPTIIIKK